MSLGSTDSTSVHFVRNDGRHIVNFDNVYDNPQNITVTRSPKTKLPGLTKTAEVIAIRLSVRDSRDAPRVSAMLVEAGHALQITQPLASHADLQQTDLDEMDDNWPNGELEEIKRERSTAATKFKNKNQTRSIVLAFGPTENVIRCTTQHFNDGCEGTAVKKHMCLWPLFPFNDNVSSFMTEIEFKLVVDGSGEFTRAAAEDGGMAELTRMAEAMKIRSLARRAARKNGMSS